MLEVDATSVARDVPPAGAVMACHRAVEEVLAADDAAAALELYLAGKCAPIRAANLEWELTAAVLELGLKRSISGSWPADRLTQPSGAALRFVVAQSLGRRDPRPLKVLPYGLVGLPALPGWARRLLAEAWLQRPDCAALADLAVRHGFARWLAGYAPAAGLVLLAVALRGDDRPKLLEELAKRWLERGLPCRAAAVQLARAQAIPQLAEIVRRLLGEEALARHLSGLRGSVPAPRMC